MSLKSLLALGLLTSLTVASPSFATSAAADDMEWQFYEDNDPDNKGAMTARLIYGVPETDNVQVIGACDGRHSTGAKLSSVTFSADIGDLANGKDADLRFSGGGVEQTLHGNIERSEGEGISGVHLDIAHDDPLWTAFAGKNTIDYLVPGYRAATLKLEPGRDKLNAFLAACRSYAEALMGTEADAKSAAPESASPEKDAFESTKELGTALAFEAFLANYPSGFYADLARAYLKKLETSPAPSQVAAPTQTPPPPPTPRPAKVKRASVADPSCKKLWKIKSQNSNTPTTITFINNSGLIRDILWLDFKGQPKNYASLNNGEQVTLQTFMTHPWMVTNGPGDCINIVLPRAGSRTVTLGGGGAPKAAAKPKKSSPAKKKKATTKCRSRSILINGKCILRRNAASYCGPGYRLKGSKCVQGYAKPKPNAQLPTWAVEAMRHGCKRGKAWNADEGCHEND